MRFAVVVPGDDFDEVGDDGEGLVPAEEPVFVSAPAK